MQLFGFTINTITLFGSDACDRACRRRRDRRHRKHRAAYGDEQGQTKRRRQRRRGDARNSERRRRLVAGSARRLRSRRISARDDRANLQAVRADDRGLDHDLALHGADARARPLGATPLRRIRIAARFFRAFNAGFERFRDWYGRVLPNDVPPALAGRDCVFAFALLFTLFLAARTPQGFLPDEDLGYFIILVQAPEGTSLQGERAIAIRRRRSFARSPRSNISSTSADSASQGPSPNRGIMFALFKPWADRKSPAWCQLVFLFAHPTACISA